MPRKSATPIPVPDEATLHQAALAYLARYSATQASVLRVLQRRVSRWAHDAAADESAMAGPLRAARAVVARLAAEGLVDDADFAAARTRRLRLAGQSGRAVTAHLRAKGVPPALAAAETDGEAELAAALLFLARRRLGPFRPEPDPSERMKDLGRLARAGYSASVASAALAMPTDEAEERLFQARRG